MSAAADVARGAHLTLVLGFGPNMRQIPLSID
jgi:hypothetical protein